MPESLIYLRRVGRRRTLNNLPVWFPLLRHSLGIERLGLVADRKRKLLRSLSVTKPNISIPKPGHRPSDITMEGRERGAKEGGQSGSPLFILGRFVNAVVISHAADLLDTTSQSHTPLEGRDGRTLRVWAQKKISQPVNNAIPSFQMGRPPAVNHHCSGIIRDKCVKVRQQTDDATRHVLKLH